MDNSTNDFDPLQRLLGCKRYEQPPPGYFISFSDKVLARIEAEQTVEYSSWWSWFLDRFDAKPVLVGMYGLAVSSLLLLGFRLSQVFDAELAASPQLGGPWLATAPGSPIFGAPDTSSASFMGSTTLASLPTARSTWRFGQDSTHSLFAPSSLQAQPINFLTH